MLSAGLLAAAAAEAAEAARLETLVTVVSRFEFRWRRKFPLDEATGVDERRLDALLGRLLRPAASSSTSGGRGGGGGGGSAAAGAGAVAVGGGTSVAVVGLFGDSPRAAISLEAL